ncbi:transmembrane protein 62-like isoform X2 [Venturia canescens]|nr:transmembrane protein 62-like isoform X2 [Venturia canescens]
MWTEPRKYQIGDSMNNLMWFLQISDLHISIFREPSRINELKEFCDTTVSALTPSVVLASGDLTDAKTQDGMGSRQILAEWKNYKQILDDTKVTKKTIWLDVRGNHDNFNVLHENSTDNFYSNYSIQGKNYPRSYMHQIKVGNEKYSFVAIDACLSPGPRRPFNFVGALDAKEIEKIHRLVAQSRKRETDYIFWFGHYPTSCIIAQCEDGVRSLIGRYSESMVYMCGHYHMLGGLVPNMYTLQQAGFLELELGDWKDNRLYRLAVIDHGQFSFTDIKHQEWPVVLVTNPKHALYVMPQKENSQSIVESTHIRILAFSLSPIKSVQIKIDEDPWRDCYHVKGPLYAAKWNPIDHSSGIHHIRALVIDDIGRRKEVLQPFTLDGTRLSFRVLPRLVLMSNASTIFQLFFGTILLVLIVPLCLLRCLHILCERNRMIRPRLRTPIFGWWARKLWILATIDRLFFPLVLYALYLAIGPWSVGEVIENQIGVVFAWGMFIGDVYLPGSFTYAYGFFQLFSFHLPLMMILAHRVEKRFDTIEKPLGKPPTIFRLLWRHFPIVLLITMQSSMVYFFWLAYGTLAVVLCPLRTWSIILAICLWYQANKMPQRCLRPAARVWSTSGRVASYEANENRRNSDDYK